MTENTQQKDTNAQNTVANDDYKKEGQDALASMREALKTSQEISKGINNSVKTGARPVMDKIKSKGYSEKQARNVLIGAAVFVLFFVYLLIKN